MRRKFVSSAVVARALFAPAGRTGQGEAVPPQSAVPVLLRGCLLAVGVLLLVVLFRADRVYAASFTVTRFDDPAPNGCAPTDCSLREAIIAANATPGSLITLPAGIFTLGRAIPIGGDTPETGDLDLNANTTISGAGADRPIIDAGGIDRVIDIPSGAFVYIEKVTLRNGNGQLGNYSHSHGGAIHNHGSLTLVDSTVSGSRAEASMPNGGGLFNAGGASAVLQNVTFRDNTASTGGGLRTAAPYRRSTSPSPTTRRLAAAGSMPVAATRN